MSEAVSEPTTGQKMLILFILGFGIGVIIMATVRAGSVCSGVLVFGDHQYVVTLTDEAGEVETIVGVSMPETPSGPMILVETKTGVWDGVNTEGRKVTITRVEKGKP